MEVGGGTFSQNPQYYDHLQQSLVLDQDVAPSVSLPLIEQPQPPRRVKQSHLLKHFKGEDLEQYYLETQLKPEVEKEHKRGRIEIRKQSATNDN